MKKGWREGHRTAGSIKGDVQHVQVMNGERGVSWPRLLEPGPQGHLPAPELSSFSKQKKLKARH